MDPTQRKIMKIARDEQRFTRLVIKDTGLEASAYPFLHAVRHNPGIGQDALAKTLCLDKTTVAHRAVHLEKKGLLRREIDPDDARKRRLYVTTRGQQLKTSMVGVEARYYEWLTKDVPREKMEIFLEVLDQLYLRGRDERMLGFAHLLGHDTEE